MTDPGELRGSIAPKANDLADEGRWQDLYALLSGVERRDLLSSPRLSYRLGEALYHTGRIEELAELAAAFEERARERADARGLMQALTLAGNAAFQLGEIETAESRWEDLLALAEAEGDEEMMAKAANNIGALTNLRGDHERALTYYNLALPLYEKLKEVEGMAQTYPNLGITYRDLSQYEEALGAYDRAVTLASRVGYEPSVILATVGQAEIKALQDDAPVALELAERGLSRARSLANPILESEALRVRALAKARGPDADPDGALDDLEDAVSLAEDARNSLLQAEIERDTAEVLVRRGRQDDSREHLESAARIFEELGASADAEDVRTRLDELT
jgi:tetratricopeptide (TPR) repeat protein